MPGRRHLWECNHTPSLSDVVKLSVEGSPTRGSPGMSGEGSPASGVLTEAGGEEELNPLDLRSDGQVTVLYHVVLSSGTATEGSMQCHRRATSVPCPGDFDDSQEQRGGL